jgi:hypothetical protein
MANITIHHSGVKAALSNVNPKGGGLRGEVMGWSAGSARRCDLFLRSVVFERIERDGLLGYAVTLTLARCPPAYRHWQQMRKAFLDRLRRAGVRLVHHVTEWQMRGRFNSDPVPHLHCVVFFPSGGAPRWKDYSGWVECIGADALKLHWLDVSDDFGPMMVGQHVELIHDIRGWFRYLSKHAARSIAHVQRQIGKMPKGWEKTGRLWGKSGQWPVFEFQGRITTEAFFALRRFCHRYQIADARKGVQRQRWRHVQHIGGPFEAEALKLLSLAIKREKHVRRSLQRNVRKVARIVPISEWVPSPVIMAWIEANLDKIERVNVETGEIVPHYALPGQFDREGLGLRTLAQVDARGPLDA